MSKLPSYGQIENDEGWWSNNNTLKGGRSHNEGEW